jgi:hypothetical protein
MTVSGVGTGVFAIRLNPTGSILYRDYLGSDPPAPFPAFGSSVDAAGNTYVCAEMTVTGYGTGVFAIKLDPNGALVYRDYLGYNPAPPFSTSVDAAGNTYIVSQMTVTGYGTGVFAIKLGPTGSLIYRNYLGYNPAAPFSAAIAHNVRHVAAGRAHYFLQVREHLLKLPHEIAFVLHDTMLVHRSLPGEIDGSAAACFNGIRIADRWSEELGIDDLHQD